MPESKKKILRSHFLELRQKISFSRREFASDLLFKDMVPFSAQFSNVLSFFNFRDEINLILLNHYLATTGRLYLPYMEKDSLRVFKVKNIFQQTSVSSFGLRQPKKDLCEEICPSQLDIAFVPALAFDQEGFRLGYGGGFYDRFLSQYSQLLSFGIGFKEQLAKDKLPTNCYDLPVKKVFLY